MSSHSQISPAYQQPITPGCIRNCIRLRGMPYSATVEDIMNFLGELSLYILPNSIHMVLNQQGRPSGDAFIQLCSPEKAGIAGLDVSKGGCHKKHMGNNSIAALAIVPPEPVPTAGSITAVTAGTLLMQPAVFSQPGILTLQTLDLIQGQKLSAAPRTAIYTQVCAHVSTLRSMPSNSASVTVLGEPNTYSPTPTPIANLTSPNSAAPAGTNPATGAGIQVRLQDMPYNAGVSDILTFLKGYNVSA
ncbi:unnamed protein product [Clavelina lepadiformis]|uniref:RRM domain-containing protein n=1 Tax=Clavelina lepadiformis TaxID=159417 RepID=A0ABP0GIU7_CLALP